MNHPKNNMMDERAHFSREEASESINTTICNSKVRSLPIQLVYLIHPSPWMTTVKWRSGRLIIVIQSNSYGNTFFNTKYTQIIIN